MIFFVLLCIGVVLVNVLFSYQCSEFNVYVVQIKLVLLIVDCEYVLFVDDSFFYVFIVEYFFLCVVLLCNDGGECDLVMEINCLVDNFIVNLIFVDEVVFFQFFGGSIGMLKFILCIYNDYDYSICCSNEICGINVEMCYFNVLLVVYNYVMSFLGLFGVFFVGGWVIFVVDLSVMFCFLLIEKYQINVVLLVLLVVSLWLQVIYEWGSNVQL